MKKPNKRLTRSRAGKKPAPPSTPPPPQPDPETVPWLEHGITQGQFFFCVAYLKSGGNGTRAYREAFGPMSDEVAASSAWRTLRIPKVRACLLVLYQETWGCSVEASAKEAQARLAAILRANVAHCYDGEGNLLPMHQLPPTVLAAVKEYDRAAGTVKLVDPMLAIRMVLEMEGKLKNPLAEATDALADAIMADVARRPDLVIPRLPRGEGGSR